MAKSKKKASTSSKKANRKNDQSDLSQLSTYDLLNGGLPKSNPAKDKAAKGKPLGSRPLKSKASESKPLEGEALIKETCRRIRAAKGLWNAHRNAACRNEREKALALYNQLSKAQKEKVPQQLRIWLRYRSEKYFGAHQTAPGNQKRSGKKHTSKHPK